MTHPHLPLTPRADRSAAQRRRLLGAGTILALGAGWWSRTGHAQAQPVIAFAQDNLQNDFRRAQVEEARQEALRLGDVRFVHSDARGQTSLLISQIEAFIGQKVNVLILGTNDERAVVPVVRKAEQAGVRVIVLDRGIAGQDYTTFINSDNVLIGQLAAKYIAERLQRRGTVLLFEGIQTADVTKLRSKGFLDEIGQHPQIKVLRRTGNYLRKDAVVEMEKLLAQGLRVDAIFSESDSMLSGVRLVLPRFGIDPRSLVMVGCDYISEAREAMRAGTQSASVLFPLGGRQAVQVARDLLAGKTVPRHISIPVQMVTPDLIDQIPPVF